MALPAAAQDFYAGKTISLAVGAGSGGGYDLYGRAVARHIPKYIPGKPNVIVYMTNNQSYIRTNCIQSAPAFF